MARIPAAVKAPVHCGMRGHSRSKRQNRSPHHIGHRAANLLLLGRIIGGPRMIAGGRQRPAIPAASVALPAFLAAGFGVTIHQFGGRGICPVPLAATHGINRYSLTLRSLSLAKTESTSMPASGSAFSTPAVPKTPASLTGSLWVSRVVTSLGTRV